MPRQGDAAYSETALGVGGRKAVEIWRRITIGNTVSQKAPDTSQSHL